MSIWCCNLQKQRIMKKLEEAIKEGKVDKDIISLLEIINSVEWMYTTSSCAGRIQILEMNKIGDKKDSKILGKWHDCITVKDVEKSLKKHGSGYIYFFLQSPIIHITTTDLEKGILIKNLAMQSGFKYSNIKSIKKDKVVVEILSSEHLQIPFGKNEKIYVDDEYLSFIVERANTGLLRARNKLNDLMKNLKVVL